MTQPPLITIGLTAYNAKETIARAVRSALDQDWDNIEVIIVDDASDDGTIEVLQGLKQQHKQINLITLQDNKGVAHTRNVIIAQAKGEYIAFFDDDDESAPHRLRVQYNAIKSYGEDNVLCHTARTQNYPNGTQRYEPVPGMDSNNMPHGIEMALRILTGKPVKGGFGSMATCSQMANISIYKNLGGFDEGFRRSEDTDFAVRFAAQGGTFLGVAEALVIQDMTHGAEKDLKAELNNHLKLLEKHQGFITRHLPYDFIVQWTTARFDYVQNRKATFFKKMVALFLSHPILTVKKIIWALPNRKFHRYQKDFHG